MANNKIIPLTVRKVRGNSLKEPLVYWFPEDFLERSIINDKTGEGLQIKHDGVWYELYCGVLDIQAAKNPADTDLYLTAPSRVTENIVPAGTVQGGTALAAYINEVDTIGAGATDAVDLPAAVAPDEIVVMNTDAAGDDLLIFPVSGETIRGFAVDLNDTLTTVEGRAHYVCETDGVWIRATDRGM